MSRRYQLQAFLFHHSRIEPEVLLHKRTHVALCMGYLYLRFSIAPLYLAQIFLYTHAQECARTHKHTQPYVHDPVGCLEGVFSP